MGEMADTENFSRLWWVCNVQIARIGTKRLQAGRKDKDEMTKKGGK